jgi:hypothetical protein
MPRSAADRQRERRQRKAKGVSVLPLEINLGAIADKLAEAGLLAEWSTEDPKAVAQALASALEHIEAWPVTRDGEG